MRKMICLMMGLFLIAVSCEKPAPKGEFGNPLIKFYGDAYTDTGNSLVSSDDGYVICGSFTLMDRITNESGNSEIVLGSEHLDMGIVFTDKGGIQKHKLTVGSPGVDDVGRKVIYYDGYYYCVGTASRDHGGSINKDVVLAKVSTSGTLEDTWYFGGEFDQVAYDIILNSSNTGFIICGSSGTHISGKLEMQLWEVQLNGELLRNQSIGYDFEGDDIIHRIVSNNGGAYIVTGTTYELPGSGTTEIRNIFVAKVNNDLNGNDFKIFDLESDFDPSDLKVLDDGGLLICGTSETAAESRGFLLKIESPVFPLDPPDYELKYSEGFGSYRSILRLSDGTYVVGGSIDNSQGNLSSSENLFLFIDANLNSVQESYITGGIGRQVINDVIEASDGKLVATGTNGDDIRSLMTLLKFDPWE